MFTKNKIMPVIGLQWGDEGKGKDVAIISSSLNENDVIVRFQGGNNAGHTIWYNGKCFVFHLIPSGAFGKAKMHLGGGMVIDPYSLKQETIEIPDFENEKHRISVSPHAVLTLPTHCLLDTISEKKLGDKKIGSTGRGIGPSYTDFVWRKALRVGDILDVNFKERYEALKTEHFRILKECYQYDPEVDNFTEKENKFLEGIDFLKTFEVKESNLLIQETFENGNNVVAEGAQGTLLDVRFGNYPYVTSSHTIAGGIAPALGVASQLVGGALGIFKAYVTKVGEGPFPTELGGEKSSVWCRDKKYTEEKEVYPNPNPNSEDLFEQGVALRRMGNEIGATTGRLRRTGWLDLPLLNYAVKINGVDKLSMTKLDVLSGFNEVKVCVKYKINGQETKNIPFDISRSEIEPVYQSFPIWKGKLSDYDGKLPEEAVKYIQFLEEEIGVPIIRVGTGPEEHHSVEKYW
ncbi:MAG: adenylosuccinate synthase [Candidatus Pacebacteria bacterium]|nr:adenylosuccinate synthase [Candidatus Paceibacterota bacterium]MCF7863061.1 adenylosuccinate synthase [Candidatus Paceibacterota bacterium]